MDLAVRFGNSFYEIWSVRLYHKGLKYLRVVVIFYEAKWVEVFFLVEWNEICKIRRGTRSNRGEIVCDHINHDQHTAVMSRFGKGFQVFRCSKMLIQLSYILTPETMVRFTDVLITNDIFDYWGYPYLRVQECQRVSCCCQPIYTSTLQESQSSPQDVHSQL